MAFANAHNVDARYGNFNVVAGDQYIINQCISQTPVPHLSHLSQAFSSFKLIVRSVDQVQSSKRQLGALEFTIATLLQTLDAKFREERLPEATMAGPLGNLQRLLDEISAFLQPQITTGFLKSLYSKEERISKIEEYHHRISGLVASFQISTLLDIQAWQSKNDDARIADQLVLHDRFDALEANQNQLMKALDAKESNILAMIASLHKRLAQQPKADRDHAFFTHSLQLLTTFSGRQVELKSWTITSFDVEFSQQIGFGGFGQVFEGQWNKTRVALKVLRSDDGVTPSAESILHEISIWSNLLHPNVLQFLGANTLDDKPFIVMPYMKNGNARQYITTCPECNHLRLLRGVALGLSYLHSRKVVHGDLKAMNVLIDDNEQAVLCDFGLSRLKADVTSRTAILSTAVITGTRNWMAPERLKGGSIKKPADIYAFGMVVYEIYTTKTPLGHIAHGDFLELVAGQDMRPERPDADETPKLCDDVWNLARRCWVKDPRLRPTADCICETILHLLENGDVVSENQPDGGLDTPTARMVVLPPPTPVVG